MGELSTGGLHPDGWQVKSVGLVRKRPPTDPGRIKAFLRIVLFVVSLAFLLHVSVVGESTGFSCHLFWGCAAVTLINSELKEK